MWSPVVSYKNIWTEITRKVGGSRELCEEIVSEIERLAPAAWAAMCKKSNRARRDSYIIRHCLLLAEFSTLDSRQIPLALAQNFLWQVAWRKIDDAIDLSCPPPELISQAIVSVAEAAAIHGANFGAAHVSEIQGLISSCIKTSVAEKARGIPLEDTWFRAALFLIIPQTNLKMSKKSLGMYKAYIAADGLAHDIHDVASDLEQGIKSLPLRWLEEIDVNRTFLPHTIARWHERCAKELRQAISRVRACDPTSEYLVLSILLNDLEQLAAEMRPRTM